MPMNSIQNKINQSQIQQKNQLDKKWKFSNKNKQKKIEIEFYKNRKTKDLNKYNRSIYGQEK